MNIQGLAICSIYLYFVPEVSIRVFIPSGAGSPGFGGITECLRESEGIQIFSGDAQDRAYGKALSDGFCLMPATDSPEYVGAVIENAKRFQCNVLLPITTRELPVLSFTSATLKEYGLATALSSARSMELVNNKARLYDFLKQCQLPCVNFAVVNTKQAFFEALGSLGSPAKKIIMKPATGNGSRGFRIICKEEELQAEYFESKAGTVKTTIAALQAELPEVFPNDILVSDYLPGEEYSVDLLAKHGQMLAIAIRIREKTISGISVRGSFVADAEMEKQCRILTDNLDLHGPVGMQFKRDENGVAKMLEINPRLQGAVSSARFAGINFPLLAVKLALEMPMEIPTVKTGVSFNRYWKDIAS